MDLKSLAALAATAALAMVGPVNGSADADTAESSPITSETATYYLAGGATVELTDFAIDPGKSTL
jgi:hypothetical protein